MLSPPARLLQQPNNGQMTVSTSAYRLAGWRNNKLSTNALGLLFPPLLFFLLVHALVALANTNTNTNITRRHKHTNTDTDADTETGTDTNKESHRRRQAIKNGFAPDATAPFPPQLADKLADRRADRQMDDQLPTCRQADRWKTGGMGAHRCRVTDLHLRHPPVLRYPSSVRPSSIHICVSAAIRIDVCGA